MWGTKSASYNLCVFDLGEQIVNSNECCDEVVEMVAKFLVWQIMVVKIARMLLV